MALIDPTQSKCAICDEGLARPYVATSGIAFPREHRLWPYCDAPLHLHCLEQWPDRLEFAAGYFDASREHFRRQGSLLRETPTWLLGCGMVGNRVSYVEVVMREWPLRFNAQREHWANYLRGEALSRLVGPAKAAASAVMSEAAAASVELGLIPP